MAKTDALTELKKQIKANEIKGLYLMYGDESYMRESYVKKISSIIDDCGFSRLQQDNN